MCHTNLPLLFLHACSTAALFDEDGHGTHVCGTALGAISTNFSSSYSTIWGPDNSTASDPGQDTSTSGDSTAGSDVLGRPWAFDLAIGAAPGARLAFFDVSDQKQYLRLPEDLKEQYYGVQYASGVRVQSDSWGQQYE